MSKRKVINLSEESYEIVKDFCEENDLKISKWCERVLLDKIKQENEKDGKKAKK